MVLLKVHERNINLGYQNYIIWAYRTGRSETDARYDFM